MTAAEAPVWALAVFTRFIVITRTPVKPLHTATHQHTASRTKEFHAAIGTSLDLGLILLAGGASGSYVDLTRIITSFDACAEWFNTFFTKTHNLT